MKLVISLATRGRPQQLLDTVQRSVANLVLPHTLLQVHIDADDAGTMAIRHQLQDIDGRVGFTVAEREDTIAAKWNRAVAHNKKYLEVVRDSDEAADLYLVAADDDPYTTPAYDERLLDAAQRFPDGVGMVYGHMANASFSGVVAPTAKLVEKMGGKIFPEHFPYWFCDHWTDDVARIIGRISFADVRTDQSKAGKTQEMREPGWWATWFDAAYLRRREQAHAIIEALDEPPLAKQRLLTHHPLIEFRSRWVNDNVRQMDKPYTAWSGLGTADARYQRVRQKAVDMIPELLAGMDEREAAHYRGLLVPPTEVPALRRAFA